MKAISKFSVVMMMAAAAVGCGGSQDVDHDAIPEPTEESYTPTPTPNAAPSIPSLTPSSSVARATDTLEISAASSDPNGDAISYEWSAIVEDADGSWTTAGLLSSETGATVTLRAPVTNGVGTVRVRCEAIDSFSARSGAAETVITVDPRVIDAGNFGDRFGGVDICRIAPDLCLGFPNLQESVLETVVPNLSDLKDEYLGATTILGHTDFQADFDVALTLDGELLANYGTGSIEMIAGAGGKGGGYRLRIYPVRVGGILGSTTWHYEILPLATNSFEPATVLAAVAGPVASGTLSAAPAHLSARMQDGMLQLAVNGFALPAFAATNVNGSHFSMGTFQSGAVFSNAQVTLLK